MPGRSARSASRPERATAASSLPDGSVAEVEHRLRHAAPPLDGRSRGVRPRRLRPARRQHPARGGVPPLPGQRHGGDPPRHRLPEHPVRRAAACPTELRAEMMALVHAPTATTSARPARPTSSSSTRPARRRSGRSSGALWTLPAEAQARDRRQPAREVRASSSTSSDRRHARAGRPIRHAGRRLPRPLPAALGGATARRRSRPGASVFEDDGSGE